MTQWNAPSRPSEYTETSLVAAILDGAFPPGSALPGERILAAQLGVTRPTLREAIQRLSRDGWLTVAHGKPTIVNDFWVKGGLNVLGKLVENQNHLPPNFISHLLEVRLNLAPAYTRAAVSRVPSEVLAVLEDGVALEDTPEAYARYDWHLHQQLTIYSGNPIYTLILNGFQGFYEDIARHYFSTIHAREVSANFYRELCLETAKPDPGAAEALCRRVMLAALDVWAQGKNVSTNEGG